MYCLRFFGILLCTLYFVGTQAAGADIQFLRGSVNYNTNLLNVRLPRFLVSDMRVANLHAGCSTFTTNIAFSGHYKTSFNICKIILDYNSR